MKKNFWSWVPTDRPWALYPLKANSHSACLNISAQPLPSHSRHALELPPLQPPPPPPFLSLSITPTRLRAQTCTAAAADLQPGWVGCRCRLVGGWERRGVLHCWAGQHPLSSGAPTDGGAHWQSHILIWLCKYLLQKAIRCIPYPVVGRQSKGEGSEERKHQECSERGVEGWTPQKIKYKSNTQLWFCMQKANIPIICLFTAPLHHQGRSEDNTAHTSTLWMATDSLNRALNPIFKCLLFFQTLLNPTSKGIYNVNEGDKVPRVRFKTPSQFEVTFPRNNTASTPLVPKRHGRQPPTSPIFKPNWPLCSQLVSEISCLIQLVDTSLKQENINCSVRQCFGSELNVNTSRQSTSRYFN